jgi:hypothetical protein
MDKKYIKFGEHTYYIDLNKLREVCSLSKNDLGGKEIQIVQTYDMDDSEGIRLAQKIEHETKSMGGNQNSMVYDILKLLIISLLENDDNQNEFIPTFGITLAINSLIEWEILKKIN